MSYVSLNKAWHSKPPTDGQETPQSFNGTLVQAWSGDSVVVATYTPQLLSAGKRRHEYCFLWAFTNSYFSPNKVKALFCCGTRELQTAPQLEASQARVH
jgi:hypothetical protein